MEYLWSVGLFVNVIALAAQYRHTSRATLPVNEVAGLKTSSSLGICTYTLYLTDGQRRMLYGVRSEAQHNQVRRVLESAGVAVELAPSQHSGQRVGISPLSPRPPPP